MLYFSKSKYCAFWQCPKMAWLKKYKPEFAEKDPTVEARFLAGNKVGDLAMQLFGDFVEATACKADGSLDLPKMLETTKAEMEKGTENICEASFFYNGLYCAVDILKKDGDGWAIYEVKSSTHAEKPVYMADVAYQKYVLEQCGVHVTNTYLVCINSDYVFDGTLQLNEFLKITDIGDGVAKEYPNVPYNLQFAEQVMNSKKEPQCDIGEYCKTPYACAFWNYCTENTVPTPSVFDLYRMQFQKALDFYRKGMTDFEALSKSDEITNEKQLRQLDYALHDKGAYVEKENIKKFLKELSYPLYFLDFETMQPVIPQYKNTRPYMQIPFQYSLHYIETEGGALKHKEFLAESGKDPRRALAEQLCKDIPMGVCTTAYNKKFECGRIKELAELYPDLSEHLLDIRDHIVDLLVPFQQGYYYNRAMGGSFSIKSVLPALFPDDPSLNYHNLEGVHNGSEAMSIFPKIQFMEKEEKEKTRHNLLKYCELDTYAMVKVWEKLKEAVR